MKYLLITSMYPKENDYYRNAFVHSRVKNYKKYNPEINITIFVLNKNLNKKNIYTYDSINVIEGNKENLQSLITKQPFNKLLIHFLDRHMMDIIKQRSFQIPTLIWVHGSEALGWYRRLFNFNFKEFPKYVLQNTRQMINFKIFIKEIKGKKVKFIFVSKWMKDILERDIGEKINQYLIIPNVIDTSLFEYKKKNKELRKKILLIRPFSSRKYANDVAIKAIKYLSKWDKFDELEFRIIGKGKHFSKLTNQVKQYSNVFIQNGFLPQSKITQFHQEYGVFLCPTRQDAQGVSMCEAMSSGLVPVTSDNTAIPEFVKNDYAGFLTKDYMEIAESIIKLYENPEMFSNLSENASHSIRMQCAEKYTIEKELEIILKNE